MITSIDAKKAFDKIQHIFLITSLQKMGIQGTYLNKIKAIYDKTTANIILNNENLTISSKIRNNTRMPTLILLLNIVLKVVTTAIGEEIKGIQIGKEELKLTLIPFADNMTLIRENPKDTTRKLLELNEFSKVAGYKISIQKSVEFLYTKSELSDREIKKTVPFIILSKK